MAVGWVLSRLHSPISVLVIVLLAIAALIGVLGSSFIGTADQYYRDQFLGISASSYSGYDGPEFLVIIKDHAGRPLKVVYSVYAWMPNGSIVGLGIYGGHGVVKINYSVIKGFSEEWIAHMALRKSDPAKILPSILLLGAIHENGSVYESLRAVPIKTPDVDANKSIVVEIVEDLRGREPIARYNSRAPGTAQRVSLKGSTTLEEFPPGSIFEGCDLACYWWILKEVYGYTIDFLPLIATYVHGPGAYKLYGIDQYIFFKSTSSVEIKAMITARVGKPSIGWFSYSIPGPTITLTAHR